jgi:exopolyphosphatase / guanosine-5'-triphosphate,3'-diphosphate pyrophosphatase
VARQPRRVPDVIAAVDLGSNSFHMVVARYSHGQLIILDRLREMVRLAAGLDKQGRLDRAVTERSLACLQRFGQRLRDMQASSVRVVGTNTLRKARRKGAFLDRAREAIGHPIEIISGIEEARLIYLGVARTMPSEPGTRLVVDIGGGSTELIVGEGLQAKRLESLYMGCVGVSQQYFADGEITEKRMRRARLAARQELEPIRTGFGRGAWDQAVGSSGTVRAIADIVRLRGASDSLITPQYVGELVDLVVRSGNIARLKLPGLTEERAPVFPGGLAILAEILDVLEIPALRVADGALREGLLYDLLGRLTDEDARMRSVRAMQARYHVDDTQADRVEATALGFLQQVQEPWGITDPLAELMLGWAARLHEVGLDISHSHYHKHSAYLLENADMPGFPSEEQKLLACIVGAHRRKLNLANLEDLTPPWHVRAELLIVLLRLAVLLHRGRGPTPLPPIELTARTRGLDLGFEGGWFDQNPLTRADLELESEYLKATGFRLRID